MTTTDTLLADLADVLDRASKLAAQMAETLAGPPVDMLAPAYHPERNGRFGGLAPGDRVMWDGQWREVAYTTPCPDGEVRVHVGFTDKTWVCDEATETVRIQKRHGNVTIPDDPLRQFRTTGGRIAYETTYADQLVAGDWVQACHGDTDWHRVDRAKILTDPATLRLMVNVWMDGGSKWWAPTDAIRVARPAADVVAAQEQAS